jgi:hypothetical protein
MDEQDTGCDVCGTVVRPDQAGGYLTLQTENETLGNVCSWLCAI